MTPQDPSQPPPGSGSRRAAALGVHLFTAGGAAIALLALLEAVRQHWAGMFAWLGLALLVAVGASAGTSSTAQDSARQRKVRHDSR